MSDFMLRCWIEQPESWLQSAWKFLWFCLDLPWNLSFGIPAAKCLAADMGYVRYSLGTSLEFPVWEQAVSDFM